MSTAVRRIGPPSLRIAVGHLIDGTDAAPIDDAAILVVNDRIVEVGPASRVSTPPDSRQLSFPEATALPGLIDAHVHVTFAGDIDPLGTMAKETDDQLVARGLVNTERMVRAGVTTAFDCGSRNSTGFAIREALLRGAAVGPRLMVSGRPVTVRRGHCNWLNGEVDGIDGIRSAIRHLIEVEGADGIKMMATGGGMTTGTDSRFAAFTVEELTAAADETHNHDRIITTHAHGVPGIRNATLGGIDGIQHTTMMGPDWSWTFDDEVAALMKARGTVACPTMGAGARVEYEGGINILEMQPNPGKITKKETIDNGRSLRAAGVKMIPATDVGVTLTDFGEEIFFELEIYAGIGFGALGAIRAATRNSARYLQIEDITGTLQAGLTADILVVDGRPDEQVTDLRRGRLVVRNGQPIQPTPAAPPPPAWLTMLGLATKQKVGAR